MASTADSRWEPWTSSVPVLRFLLLTAGLWSAALVLFAVGRFDLAVVATGVGAAAPLPILYLTAHARARIWALRLPASPEAGAAVLDRMSDAREVDRARMPRGSPLRLCVRVLRVPDPACLIGWLDPPTGGPGRSGRAILLLSAREDTPALATLRGALADAIAR